MVESAFSKEQEIAAEQITKIYHGLLPDNLVSILLPKDDIVKEWQHYPTGDIKDFKHHTQYYYHSHSLLVVCTA